MPIQRHRFDIQTDTGGDFVDTGAPFSGIVMQLHLAGGLPAPTRLKLEAVNEGVVIADYESSGGSWTRVPRIPAYDTGGDEIDGAAQYPVLAHERLRLTVTQDTGDTGAKSGTLYVTTAW